MDKEKLKLIVGKLKYLVENLESEVYSDVDAYATTQENFDDPSSYYLPISDYDEVYEDGDG